MDFGLITALGGIRFKQSNHANYLFLRANPTAPATNLTLTWLNALPPATQALTIDQNGNFGTQALAGGGGTVTSVAASMPTDLLSVSNSPITTSGTLTFSKVSQSANLIYASPDSATGNPVFRSLVANDIPSLLASKISNFDTQVRTSRLDQMAVPTANLNINGFKLTGLADPTNPQDATTKLYVDSAVSTGNNKGTARVATTANINLASPGTAIDGITLANGDLVLVKEQTSGAQNGLYVFNGSASAMTRATNADTNAEVRAGLFVFVSEGTANGNNGYTLITDDPIVLGTTILTFVQSSGAGQIVDGNGLVKTGNVFDVVGTLNRVLVNSNSVDIDPNYTGQTSIVTLGTIATGTWNGSAIGVLYGGTGATTKAGARTNLDAVGGSKGTFTSANLVSNILTITHTLNSQDIKLQLRDNNNKLTNPDDITATSNTTVTVDLTSFNSPSAITGTYSYLLEAI
jgi:hypothetical protein